MADPPLPAGALKETLSCWLAATMPSAPVVMVGAAGVVYGVPDWVPDALPAAHRVDRPHLDRIRGAVGDSGLVPSADSVGDRTGDRPTRPSSGTACRRALSEYQVDPPSVDHS